MHRFLTIVLVVFVYLTVACTSSSEDSAKSEGSESKEASIEPVDPSSFGISTDEDLPMGLSVGSKAPGFAGRDNKGESFDLYSKLKNGPVVLLFYRGKWCPVCSKHMSNFNDSVNYILQKGAQVIAVTPELGSNAAEFAEATSTEFPIISDPTTTIMDAFDVTYKVTDDYVSRIQKSKGINIAENNGNDVSYLPVPATYIIDQTGTIIYRQFDLNYRNRASVNDILNNLK